MYPPVGVDASGLATLRATVLDQLRGFVPTAYTVPAFATAVPAGLGPAGPCYALTDGGATVGRRGRAGGSSAGGAAAGTTAPAARRPTADSDQARMMDLVERAQAGEADAFGRLYDQYSDTVYRYIYYRVGGKATAEDLTSETFLRALRRISTFTWQGRDFGAWLVTIARNLVADHFKSSRFRLEVTTGEMLDANEVERSPEDSVLESLSNAALLEAVRKLNPQQQECVTLRFLQGLSVAETARVMGKNEGAIKTLQYRAVRTLARLLPDDAR
ncbi:sigma-70 family RNA polymerase sigma factor [Streptomyces sp. ZAF1911]|uniref:ECF subfamily RNA polymerase sigma factor, BldN family n=1 Tax=Streptomyces TaxID=1883 RepID=UPI001FB012AD|nr:MULTISPECIES: ECF subfamily RNA polymerase sigma factor, BldN family [unclassified Streptomyces]MCJ0874187.1 sigma-70 family RNA polymerase sigma factor [Streptomyces sp. AP-93]MCM1967499.1 sigma-70 family RNA polymerase sigma factor [Streptomyces sp. G1]MCX5123368.1 sigma-70 family RNA polymerase sigma factor [Streptomyces sp. NBC_00347]MCX5296715.1 sigma-70 family RNA polymerase sigma factor [Streptomyces sp. NBC_00193]MDD9378032.1 sigma-70 family RNA polymerase sigma factor [Streptomyces